MLSVVNELTIEKTIKKINVQPHSLIIWQMHFILKIVRWRATKNEFCSLHLSAFKRWEILAERNFLIHLPQRSRTEHNQQTHQIL